MRNAAANTLLVIASVVVALLLLEAGLRIGNYPRRDAKLVCLDPVIHNVFCPKVTTVSGAEKTPVVINKDGMADREYAYAKPAGTLRVALLGDSVTASIYTAEGRKFEQLWERALTEHLGRPVEVLNFGLDGTGTWEQVQIFRLRARKFSPDYTILAFYWGNDVWNNHASFSRKRPNPLKDEYDTSRWITAVKVAHRNSIRWLWNHSAAFQLLDTAKSTLEAQFAYDRARRAAASPTAPIPEEHDPALLWNSEAWELTRNLIVKLKQECDDAGTKLIVFGIPMLDQITRPKPVPYRELRGFLDAHRIAHVDIFDKLEALTAEQKKALYIGDNAHLSDEGHRFYATQSLPRIEALLVPRDTSALARTQR